MELIRKEECYRIIGACFEVYKEKGTGFSEGVYQERLDLEFVIQAIPAQSKVQLQLEYKGKPLECN